MAVYAALATPQLQFSAGPARFFFQAHPNSLKLLDEFRVRQAGVSERRTFSFYLDRASLMEHILRERDLFECNLVPPPAGAAWDLNCDNFQNVRKCSSHSSASFRRARAVVFGPRFSGAGSYCPLLKAERMSSYLFPSARRNYHRTRPAYPHGSIRRRRRARPAVRLIRCVPPRIAHGGPADPFPISPNSRRTRKESGFIVNLAGLPGP